MSIRRPTPEIIAARQWEIKRRYSRKGKVGKRTRSMAAIRLAELTRWLDLAHGSNLAPCERSYDIVRIFAHHMGGLPDAPRRITAWLAAYSPWLAHIARERLISEVTSCPLKWSADKLAWKLHLTDAQRTRLKIRTIGAIDVSRDERAARRKAKQAELQRALRAARKAARVNSI